MPKQTQTNPDFHPCHADDPRRVFPQQVSCRLLGTNQFAVLLISLQRSLCGVKGLAQRVSCFTRAEEFLCLQF